LALAPDVLWLFASKFAAALTQFVVAKTPVVTVWPQARRHGSSRRRAMGTLREAVCDRDWQGEAYHSAMFQMLGVSAEFKRAMIREA
jgi:hypothetical protein